MHYQLDWSWDRVERDAGGSWQVVNDLGYRVHVTRGYVTTYSMELVECAKKAAATPGSRFASGLWSLVEGTAHAGHASGTPNPAAMRAMQVESLTAPTASEAGDVTLAPQAYCQLHYLVARAAREARGLPAELDMVDTSLHIEGAYRGPGDSADVAFTVHTVAAYGALFNHTTDSAALYVDTGRAATRVVVRRHLGAIFDKVDFSRMKPSAIADQILRSLVEHAEVEIHRMDEHA